jgi:HK97 gp10 family phage protein
MAILNTVGGTEVVHGMREVALNLEGFPEKLQRKALATALRAAGRVVRDIARSKVPVKSGKLRRSIRVTIVRKGGNFTARIIAGRRVKKDDPFYAWMVEGGTKAHEIRPKGKKSLFLAGIFAEQIQHPGADAKAFLGPALEAGAVAALEAMRERLASEIESMGSLA